jgi:hypothetical protein
MKLFFPIVKAKCHIVMSVHTGRESVKLMDGSVSCWRYCHSGSQPAITPPSLEHVCTFFSNNQASSDVIYGYTIHVFVAGPLFCLLPATLSPDFLVSHTIETLSSVYPSLADKFRLFTSVDPSSVDLLTDLTTIVSVWKHVSVCTALSRHS